VAGAGYHDQLMSLRYQVVIVGGGPVGMALAVDLGLRGISCAVVERHRTPQRIPKGQSLTQRTLEHFYAWGIADKLRAARLLPPGYPIGSITAYGSLMGDYWFGPDTRERVSDFYFQKNERLPQYLTEEVLRRRAGELPQVECFFGRTATGVEQSDDCVRVTMRQEEWPYEDQVLEADYLVGCDGARSMVRESMRIDRGGADFDQRMVLAVFRSAELHARLEKRFPECTTYRVLKPELNGYWQFFGRVDVGEGWFFHAPVPRDTQREDYDFLGLLQSAAGFKFDAQFDHVGFWDLRISVAQQYRVGRVFIAGDACHSHPPYGGFGLNSGLEDVANLGWKLAAVLNNWGGEALLDSYDAERRPIFVETGEAMIAGGIERDRAFLERYQPERNRAEFEAAWQQLTDETLRRRQSYEPHYEGSPVVAGPVGGVCSIQGRQSPRAEAGHHVKPVQLSNGRNVFEELGPGYTLLAWDAESEDVDRLVDGASSLRVPLKVIRDTYSEMRREYAARLILVRPDQYVCWAGDGLPQDASQLLRQITGMLSA
jgi:2-polyprenyl-6-methoxyphenol hydroxylase-like FAD-dependent oxidoreductase